MKRLLFAPLIFLITLPVFGESLDPKILCMRNRVKFDKERIAYNNYTKYSLKTWYPAIEKEKNKQHVENLPEYTKQALIDCYE